MQLVPDIENQPAAPGPGRPVDALRKVLRTQQERRDLEDRLLCTICMEAEAPRTVLFGPCNHFLACASCAAALAECPNCRATITTRTSIANSS